MALAIKHADCLPLFFVDPSTRTIAIAHAGWKGVMSGIAIETVRAMSNTGCQGKTPGVDPRNVLVAIGPSIGSCHYSIHTERRDIMLAGTPFIEENDFTSPSPSSRICGTPLKRWLAGGETQSDSPLVDLRVIVVRQLISSGVLVENIDVSAPCTACHPDQYFSYRLEHGSGQLLSVISIKSV